MQTPYLSIALPCYNEEECIGECYRRVTQVLAAMDCAYELVFVDDGSQDATAEQLRLLHEADKHVVVLSLSRNFGHQPAVTAGMSVARGDAIVILDADLQDPPELIPKMVALWQQGYKVVYGVRSYREGETHFKLWTAKLFYRMINSVSDISIPLDTGDFRLLDRCVVDAFAQMPERHRLLRGMSSWIGFSQIGISYERSSRVAGETKYPLRKMMSLAMDGIVSFSTAPLKFVTMIGFVSALIAFAGIVYTIFIRLFTRSWVRGWAISFVGMLLIAGIQLLCLGILGEYIGRIYTESKQRPLFFVKEQLQAELVPAELHPADNRLHEAV